MSSSSNDSSSEELYSSMDEEENFKEEEASDVESSMSEEDDQNAKQSTSFAQALSLLREQFPAHAPAPDLFSESFAMKIQNRKREKEQKKQKIIQERRKQKVLLKDREHKKLDRNLTNTDLQLENSLKKIATRGIIKLFESVDHQRKQKNFAISDD